MELFLISLFSCLGVVIGFTGLLPKHLSPLCHLSILTSYFIFAILLGNVTGQWLTLPYTLFVSLLVYFSSKRSTLNVIFSLVGYFISCLANHLISIPLSILGFSLDFIAEHYYIPFLLSWLALTMLIFYFIRKFFILPKLFIFEHCSPKLLRILLIQLFFCIALFTLNFTYGDYTHYPSEVLTFNGILIIVFTLFTFVIFYCLFNVFYQNHQLELKQREQELLLEYTQQLEAFYKEMRHFRHDYQNILITMQHYISDGNLPQLQEYFNSRILPSGQVMSDIGFTIGKLHLIKSPTLKSILYVKMMNANNSGLTPELEIMEDIEPPNTDDLILCRILGNLLDNCTEAALQTEEKFLKIAVVSTEHSIIISLTNSTPPITVPISNLTESGYTTKENHDGLGLASVKNMLLQLKGVAHSMKYDTYFHQEIVIAKNTNL